MKSWRKKTGKKKERFTGPDEFQSFTQKAMAYAKENTSKVYIGLAVLGVVIVAAMAVTLMMQSSRRRVAAVTAEALKYYDINSPIPGAKPLGMAERLKKADELLGEVSNTSARGADVALYYKANAEMELGDINAAIAGYMKLKGRASDPALVSLANQRLAGAYLAKGDTQKAMSTYMDNIKADKGFLKDEAHFQLAGIYMQSGQKDRALAEYKEILKNFPGSPYMAEAKLNIDKLEGKPAGAVPGSAFPSAAPAGAAPVQKK